jgi:hypothetical protein
MTGDGENCLTRSFITRMIKSRRMRCAGHLPLMWKKRNAYSFLVEKAEGKRPLGRPRRRYEVNIKIDDRQKDGMVWIGLILLKIWTTRRLL